ncbi:ABC-three component system middle component 2 [Trueperella pyogenes]|uniref:ABC-three component system middle component 2 n=1 Tax=Trueperella pyogenes TaxID=1661 RepID=UPI000F899A8F|nr:ABC-three component system middle component 2 [Trueperella pyogenes]
MNNIFNTPLAMATRAAIILSARPNKKRDEKSITAIDLLVTHAYTYKLAGFNLHGDVEKPSIELAARTHHMREGIKFAVTKGLLTPLAEEGNYLLAISDLGLQFLSKLDAAYVGDYKFVLNSVLAFVDTRTYEEVITFITQTDIQGEQHGR